MSTDRAVDAREVIAQAIHGISPIPADDKMCRSTASVVLAALAAERLAVVPVRFVEEVALALKAATTIGMRSCRDGDHLHYANHDRLVAEAATYDSLLAGLVPVAVDDRYPEKGREGER